MHWSWGNFTKLSSSVLRLNKYIQILNSLTRFLTPKAHNSRISSTLFASWNTLSWTWSTGCTSGGDNCTNATAHKRLANDTSVPPEKGGRKVGTAALPTPKSEGIQKESKGAPLRIRLGIPHYSRVDLEAFEFNCSTGCWISGCFFFIGLHQSWP